MKGGAALALLVALAACGGNSAPTGSATGSMHAMAPNRPPHVVSMSPCIDAILVRVADPAQIVSISHYSHDPAATSIPLAVARRYPANRETAEEVVAQRPDVVLLSMHVSKATQAAIRSVGVRIESLGVPASIGESRDQIARIARIVGHPERGRALLAQIDAALAAARPPAGAMAIPALVRESGGLVPGTGTVIDELLGLTGFRNMSADYGLAMWDILPLEPMIARPPRVLLTDRSSDRRRQPLLGRLPGMHVAAFPDRLLSCAGPTLIDAARLLATIRRQASSI